MLTKIIDLGHEVPETGEPRVRLIQNSLVKTASTEIQQYWDSIDKGDSDAYLWVIGVSAKEYYGCNNNGDAFTEEDLKNTHGDFVSTAHVFLQHVNKDPNKSIGKPVFSWYNDAMHRVELILKIDKNNPDSIATVTKIKNGEPIFVSMGCFPAGTKILMADDSEKNIEDVQVCDEVVTHTNCQKPVNGLMALPYTGILYTFTLESAITGEISYLSCTEEHPILVGRCDELEEDVPQPEELNEDFDSSFYELKEEWIAAKEILEGDNLLFPYEVGYEFKLVTGIEKKRVENLKVYNLSVADDNSYIANKVAVHNCTVAFDQCSICGNRAPTRKDYCDHLRYNMKKILPDGRQVFALNPNPKFFDISIVARPADPTAHTLDKMASLKKAAGDTPTPITSAELGEMSSDIALKLASLRKVSDIVKKVDGHVVDAKGGVESETETERPAGESFDAEPIRVIQAQGFKNFEYPEMPYGRLSSMGVSPFGLLACLSSLNAPITLGDAAWMSGVRAFGRNPSDEEYGSMFSLLPHILPRLINQPDLMDGVIMGTLGSYNGEFETPAAKAIIIRVIKPVAQARIQIIRKLSTPEELVKIGEALGQPLNAFDQFGHTMDERILNDFRKRKENFAQITLTDKFGNQAVTTPYHLKQTIFAGDEGPKLFAKPTIAAALALGTIAAVVSQPDLLRKALALAAAGLPTAAIVNLMKDESKGNHQWGVVTSEGDRISDSMAAQVWKLQKTSSEKTAAIRASTLAGMAVPGALALDYAYNRWKYGPYMSDTTANQLGEMAAEHPAAAALTGALAGYHVGKIPALLRLKRMKGLIRK